MKVYSSIEEICADQESRSSVVTVGSFDGVHRGHRAVVDRCVELARARSLRAMAVTFSQHPLSTLAPPHAPTLLTSSERKIELLGEIGVDAAVCLTFDEELAAIEAEDFARDVLVGRCRAATIVCGYDFNFGRGGRGGADTLRAVGTRSGVELIVVPPQVDEDLPISGTRIREALMEGRIPEANRLLGRRFDLEGLVVAGARRGRNLEFPTANILVSAGTCLPLTGVYAVWARTQRGEPYKAMMNIGRAPTFGLGENKIEAHLFGFKGDLYGARLRVEFAGRLREERKFDSIDALMSQLRKDREAALEALSSDEC